MVDEVRHEKPELHNQFRGTASDWMKFGLVIQTCVSMAARRLPGNNDQVASNADLEFQINATCKHSGLTDFNARQGARGVSAAPWNTRRVFVNTFMVGKFVKQVFVRTSKEQFPVKKLYGAVGFSAPFAPA